VDFSFLFCRDALETQERVWVSPFIRRLTERTGRNGFVSYGLLIHLLLLSTPPCGDAVTVSYRPECAYLKRTCTSLAKYAYRRTYAAPAGAWVHSRLFRWLAPPAKLFRPAGAGLGNLVAEQANPFIPAQIFHAARRIAAFEFGVKCSTAGSSASEGTRGALAPHVRSIGLFRENNSRQNW
jgi:hypothetical protein